MKSKKQHVKNESGRTMVEMLAVLGIVGLITVGSVAGFKQIMNVIRANETIERLSKRAWDISDSIIMDKTPSLAAFSPDDGSYTIDTLELGQNGFSLTVHDVQPEVCSKLVDQNISGAVILSGGDCRVTGNMVFLFNNRLESQNHDICTGFESTACIPTCDSEAGYTFAEVGTQCGPNEQHACDGKGHCLQTSACYASAGLGYFATGNGGAGNCVRCDSDSIEQSTQEECYTCLQRSWADGNCYLACANGEFRTSSGECVSCSEAGEFDIDKAECGRCTNRFWDDDTGRCILHCGADTFRGDDGVCHPCNDANDYPSTADECAYCSSRAWISGICAQPCVDSIRDLQSAECVSCDVPDAINTTKDDCDSCAGRYHYETNSVGNGICYPSCGDNAFHERNGECIDCSSERGYISTEEECNRCSDRTYDPTSGQCVAACSSGFRDISGICIECSDANTYTSTKEQCELCSGRYWDYNYRSQGTCYPACEAGNFHQTDGTCVACSDPLGHLSKEEECGLCGEVRLYDANKDSPTFRKCIAKVCADTSFRQANGDCIECSAGGEYDSTEAECSRCSDRTYDSVSGKCVAMCNNGFHNLAGECIDCANTSKYTSTKEECDLCTDRYWDQSQRTCFSGCADGFHQTNGTCIECSVVGAYVSTKAECDRCTGRYWNPSSKNCHSICVLGESFRSAETHECVSCSIENDVIGMSETECLACEGRAWDATTGKCSLNS